METSKRSSYHEDTELRLGLPGRNEVDKQSLMIKTNKRTFSNMSDQSASCTRKGHDDITPPTKAQVIGWPPVKSYRKNCLQQAAKSQSETSIYVKVSMDGAAYLRKIDLGLYKGYKELLHALKDMFKLKSDKLSIGENNIKGSSEYEPTYEDKDGDWMLVGDVPWAMFITSCKKLRIMKGSSDTKSL